MMRYKDYVAKVEFDDEADLLHGEVVNTRDVITFQGQSVDEIRRAFQESVDAYLAFCAERGEEPEKPFSGKFVVRVSSELHQRVFIAAQRQEKSLNAWVVEVLDRASAGPQSVASIPGRGVTLRSNPYASHQLLTYSYDFSAQSLAKTSDVEGLSGIEYEPTRTAVTGKQPLLINAPKAVQ